MKKISSFLIILALVATPALAGPETPIDSLYRRVSSATSPNYNDVNRLMVLLDAAGLTDSLRQYDRSDDRHQMMAATHLSMADYYYEQAANMTATMHAARRAEEAARSAKDTATVEEALAYQAVAASRMGQLDVALAATREELRLDSLTHDLPNLSRAYNTLAGLSLQAGRIDDAKHYIHKAIEMERALEDSAHLSVRYGVAAEIYVKAGDLQRALDFAQQAYALDRTAGSRVRTARRQAQMADIYEAMGNTSQAEQLYLLSTDSLRAEGEQKSLAINLKQLGQLYLKVGRNADAMRVLRECEDICRKTSNRYTLQQTCRLLAEACSNTDPRRALAYSQEALQLNDSLHSQRAQQMAEELQRANADDAAPAATSDTTKTSFLRTFLLLALAAAVGILAGRFWGKRKKNAAVDTVGESGNTGSYGANGNAAFSSPTATSSEAATQDMEFLAKVSEIYDQHLGHQRLGIDELASEMCMSRSQFTRRIAAATGTSANNYFNRLRLEKACRLLKDTEKPISIIAEECGFDDPSYFSNIFKKTYRVTPMQYRIMPQLES